MIDALGDAALSVLAEFGLPALFVVFALKGALVGKPLPTSVLLPGYLLAVSASDRLVAVAVVVASAGYVAGQIVVFLGARRYGSSFVASTGWISVSEPRLDRANRWFRRYGGASVFVTNLVPYVGSFVLIPAGIARYPFGRVVVYATVSTVLNYVLIVWAVLESVEILAGRLRTDRVDTRSIARLRESHARTEKPELETGRSTRRAASRRGRP